MINANNSSIISSILLSAGGRNVSTIKDVADFYGVTIDDILKMCKAVLTVFLLHLNI